MACSVSGSLCEGRLCEEEEECPGVAPTRNGWRRGEASEVDAERPEPEAEDIKTGRRLRRPVPE